MITLGLDIGSSSIKAALFDTQTGTTLAHATVPDTELPILSPEIGFAEQDPELWWRCVVEATGRLKSTAPKALASVGAVGIAYQMHGLVLLGTTGAPVRPAIIWCDSRATEIGRNAFDELGHEWCLSHLLNSPGNFTASKLRWVILNQPDLVKTAKAMLLPGDFIAYQLTGEPTTTIPGLSEGMLWDFNADAPATELLKLYSISPDLVPRRVPTFGEQGNVTAQAAQTLGIPKGIPVTYRAGDQPNNAFSLNVLDPGEVAATAGTSGVVYAVGGGLTTDPKSRVNAFAHVNHSSKAPRIGTLLCINGTGIANSWVRRLTGNGNMPYADLNTIAAQSAVGSQGVVVLPFGNGAERFFGDRLLSAQISGLDFTRQSSSDVLRSVQEGIAFSLATGLQLMPTLGITPKVIRAGLANMFLSPIFCETLAAVSGISIELYRTDGAEGAARGAAIGVGAYKDAKDAFRGFQSDRTINPPSSTSAYHEAMRRWTEALEALLAGANK